MNKTNELTNISNALEDTLKDADLQNVTADLAEAFTDTMFTEGVLKDIPVLGTVLGLVKTTMNLRDRLFVKKLIHFLSCLNSIDPHSRHKMIAEIDASQSFKMKVGEKLLYIIDKCEDHHTASYIGRLFSAFLKGDIVYAEFLRGAAVIDNIFSLDLEQFLNSSLDDIKKVEKFYDDPLSEFQHRLINAGICITSTEPINVHDQDDWKASEQYIVEGGGISIYVTGIGQTIKGILGTS